MPACRCTHCRAVWTTASVPWRVATPTCRGHKKSRAGTRTSLQRHLAVSRRNVSPTAMGRTSSAPLGNAWRVAPARWGATSSKACPRAKSITTSARLTAISSPWAEPKASRRWSPRKPVGPAALPRLKLLMAWTTSSTPSSGTAGNGGGPSATRAGLAGVARGCLAWSLTATSPVLSKRRRETRAAQARENSPSEARPPFSIAMLNYQRVDHGWRTSHHYLQIPIAERSSW